MKWSMLWDLCVHNMSLPFDHTCCLDKSELETCLRFPVRNRNRKLRSESSFLFLLLPTVQFDVVLRHVDLRHELHTNSCRQHVLNPHVLVSLSARWILRIHSDTWEFLLPRVPHLLLRFPFRHLHEILQLVRWNHQLVLHLESEFSSDLRTNCSAIPVSRLLTVLRRIMISIVHIVGLGRVHFSVQVENENVVFEKTGMSSFFPYQFTNFSK